MSSSELWVVSRSEIRMPAAAQIAEQAGDAGAFALGVVIVSQFAAPV